MTLSNRQTAAITLLADAEHARYLVERMLGNERQAVLYQGNALWFRDILCGAIPLDETTACKHSTLWEIYCRLQDN